MFNNKPNVLYVANVAKEHILKFHVPTIKYMKDNGWRVDVACSGTEKIPFCDHQFNTSWKRSPFSSGTIKGIRELKKIIAEGHYDVVFCHTPVGGAIARIASKKFKSEGLKVIYMAHGFHFYSGAPLINWLLYYPVEKILSRWTDCIITINKEDFNRAKERFHCKKVEILDGIGIDLSRFRKQKDITLRINYRNELKIPQESIVMVYLAELIPNKNQKLLLDVLKEIRGRGYDAYLLLAGVDHNNGKDLKYAEKIGVRQFVRYLGWRSDIDNLYSISDVCTASSIREGFGINIVEAMASGLPVVATRNRGHVTIIENNQNGYLVPIGSVKEYSDAVIKAIENKDTFIKRYELEKYESKIISSKQCNIIQSILDMDS